MQLAFIRFSGGWGGCGRNRRRLGQHLPSISTAVAARWAACASAART